MIEVKGNRLVLSRWELRLLFSFTRKPGFTGPTGALAYAWLDPVSNLLLAMDSDRVLLLGGSSPGNFDHKTCVPLEKSLVSLVTDKGRVSLTAYGQYWRDKEGVALVSYTQLDLRPPDIRRIWPHYTEHSPCTDQVLLPRTHLRDMSRLAELSGNSHVCIRPPQFPGDYALVQTPRENGALLLRTKVDF